ncbi:MAG: hypothetical protein Kow0047_28920 [Anaerolineae bacterium]
MRGKRLRLVLGLLLIVLAGVAVSARWWTAMASPLTQGDTPGAQATPGTSSETPTFDPSSLVTIRPATEMAQVSAAGNVELVQEWPVIWRVGGVVQEIAVGVGDQVSAGQFLASLDTVALERAVQRAELVVASKQASLEKLTEEADPAELASARAALESAQKQYEALLQGTSEEELANLRANLIKAELALKQAQSEYDKVAWRPDVGMTQQGIALQEATADYEAAKAAYEAALKGADEADLAAARAQIASAQAQLESLTKGASEADIKLAEIELLQAQIDLDEAREELEYARLRSPIDGTVLSVSATVGEMVSAGQEAFRVADLSQLQVTVNVAEVDIVRVRVGQSATVTIDALPGRTFHGVVARITPSTTSQQGVVNYPVTIRLTDADPALVRPGMTAVTTILNGESSAGWLVPTTAIRQRNGNAMVLVVRDGQPTPIRVTVGEAQGEWTFVSSDELREGDQVVGNLASFVNQESQAPGPGGFRVPMGAVGGRPPGAGR